MKKKKLLYTAVLAISVLSLTACGELNTVAENPGTSNVVETQDVDTTTDVDISEDENINSNYVLSITEYTYGYIN